MNAISPDHLGLVVIDVQAGLFSTHPPPFEAGQVIARINSVTAKARAADVPVFFVQHDGPAGGDWLAPHSKDWELHPALNRLPAEPVIRKTTNDAFYGSTLEKTLRELGIRSLVLLGYATEFCIDTTLRIAGSKEFEVFVVSDAHTTNDSPILKASAIRQYFNWAWAESSSPSGIHLISTAEFSIGPKPNA